MEQAIRNMIRWGLSEEEAQSVIDYCTESLSSPWVLSVEVLVKPNWQKT